MFARCLSAIKDERTAAAEVLTGPAPGAASEGSAQERDASLEAIHDALYCAKICSYAQGFQRMRAAQAEYGWRFDFGEIARIWRGGCIIRAVFPHKITEAYRREPDLGNLLLDPNFQTSQNRPE